MTTKYVKYNINWYTTSYIWFIPTVDNGSNGLPRGLQQECRLGKDSSALLTLRQFVINSPHYDVYRHL